MLSDEQLLSSVPEHITVGGLLKASPSEEDGERILYFEASNEDVDHQNEVVLQKALSESSDYYLRHGNVDLSHFSLIGPKAGISNHLEYEVGRPLEVRVDGKRTMVKAQLYRGDSPMARNANMVWDSLTKQSPPARWYPSVGGSVLAKSVKIDPVTKNRVAVVEKVRWNNIALDRCPVNKSVGEVSTVPAGVFAKSLGGFVFGKALEAGYGADVAELEGGAALRKQSLLGAPANYYDFRNRLADALRGGKAGKNPGVHTITDYAARAYGLPLHQAAEWVEHFVHDLKTGLKNRRRTP